MSNHAVLYGVLYAVSFLLITCTLQIISKRWSGVPYTALLILAGFAIQACAGILGMPIALQLSPDVIYFILLPLLLFESAFHISIHHFRLQFNTIFALASVGLLISVAVVGGLIYVLTDLSLPTAFLFGAVISSTDPIAVIALFKQLGAPRRLGLVADGESMLNDATSVIVFKAVAAVVLGASQLTSTFLVQNAFSFLWVFVASLLYGLLLGLFTSFAANRLRANLLAMNLLATAMALFVFASAEHFFGLSGVIATVSYGVIYGNLAVPLFDHHQETAFEHFWELVSLLSLSIVFFFSSLSVDVSTLAASLPLWPAVIFALLVGRAVSVYAVCAVTNNHSYFRFEPKIPLSWQHVLVWGGLRGVIPLVLAYSLPLTYEHRDLIVALTIACFLFTLLVNGFTIKPLLVFLKLHRPRRTEQLFAAQRSLIKARGQIKKLENLPKDALLKRIIDEHSQRLVNTEVEALNLISSEQSYSDILCSLKMAGNAVEREYVKELFNKGYLDAEILSAFNGQLNQQLDRIEYPDLPHRLSKKELSFDTSTSWRNQLASLLGIHPSNRSLFWLFGANKSRLLNNRYSLLQVRILTSRQAVAFFGSLREPLANCPLVLKALDEIGAQQHKYIQKNRKEMVMLRRAFTKTIRDGQSQLVRAALEDEDKLPLLDAI